MSEHSSDPLVQRMTEFCDRFDSLFVPDGQGHTRVETAALLELVRDDPESVTLAAQVFAQNAQAGGPSARGDGARARLLASGYEVAFSDDTLTVWVEHVFAEAESTVPAAGIRLADNPREVRPPRYVEVDRRMLAERDIYPFVSAFSQRAARSAGDIERMRADRASIVILCDIPGSDPRAVWSIPEVRDYMALLDERMPYLPYFFTTVAEFSALFTWFACLIPADTLFDGDDVLLSDPTVMATIVSTMSSVRDFADLLGDDPDTVIAELFAAWPQDYVAALSAVLRDVEGGSDD